jgi:hypothetical protein
MSYDPLAEVIDEPLTVNASVIQNLLAFRHKPKLQHLPGINPSEERTRLSAVVNSLTDSLLQGIEAHPTKLWVMAEFQRHLRLVASGNRSTSNKAVGHGRVPTPSHQGSA